MLVDTSGFFSLYDEADEHHGQAVSLYEQVAKRLTTSYVLAEYTALAHVRGVPCGAIIKFSRLILDDKDIEIIWVDENLHRQSRRADAGKNRQKLFALRCSQFRRDARARNR